MKILIVEDEQKTRAYLQKGLEEAGFTVDAVERGEDALQVIADGHHDLIILDVMLPGLDGWAIVSGMRASGDQTPVLMLTARDQVQDRVRRIARAGTHRVASRTSTSTRYPQDRGSGNRHRSYASVSCRSQTRSHAARIRAPVPLRPTSG